MLLKKYYDNLNKKFNKVSFNGFEFNSKKIKKNYIFFAISGNKYNGNDFIKEAINKGASIIFSNKYKTQLQNKILYIKVSDTRLALANFSSRFFSKKPKNLIAVTGTNGKSSIANFYYQILRFNKKRVGSIGTLGVKFNTKYSKLINTTADTITLNKILHNFKEKKIENIILEASSHGLDQKRLHGIIFNSSIFTNLSRDHLDYHKNYNNYLNSKLILFNQLTKKNGNMIYDNDINISNILRSISKKNLLKPITIGFNTSTLKIVSIKILNNNQYVSFLYKNKIYDFKTALIGKIQIKNLLMSVVAAINSNLKISDIVKSLKFIKPVSGRLELVGKTKNNSIIILDYAHTPEALKICLQSVREQFPLRKISIVFGCGGDRDKKKRPIMGNITNKFCDQIYLTDDNPRNENPNRIRNSIKKSINKNKLNEIPSRSLAIRKAILNCTSNEVLVIAGRGHEVIQEYKENKEFSDKKHILENIKIKNKLLSKDWKINVLNEIIKNNKLKKIKKFKLSTNSKNKNQNAIFFGIKGKFFNGNNYADEAIKNGANLAIVDKSSKFNSKKIRVANTLNLLNNFSKKIRISSDATFIAITGSSGKTSLKELLGQCLNTKYITTYSKRSYNNKYGVPISLLETEKNTKFGVFEIGMDKKGEIDTLSKIVKPNIGIITNISYAHAKNFKSLFDIAKAKAEIINNITRNGTIILNKDDQFFKYFYTIAKKNNLNVLSFGKSNTSDIKFVRLKKIRSFSNIIVKVLTNTYEFKIKNNLVPYLNNILASLTVLKSLNIIDEVNRNFFINYKIPNGRGNINKIQIGKKKINLIDETYNSNPLSLKFSINKFDNLKVNKSKKYLLLGDMLELGKFSKKLHAEISNDINKAKFNKIFVYGKEILETFNKIRTQKKGRILNRTNDIYNLLKNDLNNGDYLMIKGSNSTGLNKLISKIKRGKNAF